jgi:hypothetical protein
MSTRNLLPNRRRIALGAAGACSVLIALGAAPVSEASPPTRWPLVGPAADISCQELEPGEEDVSEPGPGFVVFRTRSGTVSARVVLRGAEPSTDYPVRLLQSGDDATNCFVVNGVVHTNARGRGLLRVSEPITGEAAQVIVNTGALFGLPTYRALQAFNLPPGPRS